MLDNFDTVVVWERNEDGVRVTKNYPAPYYFYVDDENGKHTSLYGDKLSKIRCKNASQYYKLRKELQEDDIRLWESDISPELRILSQHYYEATPPKLHVAFYDIEVDYDPNIGFASAQNPYAPINALALYHRHTKRLIAMGVPPDYSKRKPKPGAYIPPNGIWTEADLEAKCNDICTLPTTFTTEYKLFQTEAELLEYTLKEIADTDLLAGWNSDFFDNPYLTKRVELVLGEAAMKRLSFPRAPAPKFSEVMVMNNTQLKVDWGGRICADYMQILKKYEPGERPSYKLESVSETILRDPDTDEPLLPKLKYTGSLASLYVDDFATFMRYNIRDCEILNGFEDRLGYIELANVMYHMSCGQFQHVTGTLKLAELAIINFCHYELGVVVNNTKAPDIDRSIDGAYVLFPIKGRHRRIGSIDINSLYPSAIRSLNASPETLRGQFILAKIAVDHITRRTDTELSLQLEDTGEIITKLAHEWPEYLKERKWSMSGYGTVFTQEFQGVIPSILEAWYASRKQYQAQKAKANARAKEILANAKARQQRHA